MAKLSSYHKLLDKCMDSQDFLDISMDKDPHNVIVTCNRNMACVIELSTQKALYSWSVVKKFTSKVIYEKTIDRYVGAYSGGILRVWEPDIIYVDRCKAIKFQMEIRALVDSVYGNYVLYANETFEPLTTALERPRQKKCANGDALGDQNIRIKNAKIHKMKNGSIILAYHQVDCKTKIIEFVILTLMNEKTKAKRILINNTTHPNGVNAAAIIDSKYNDLSLMTIRNNGKMYVSQLTENDDFNNEKYIDELRDIVPEKTDNGFPSLTFISVGKDYVFIYGSSCRAGIYYIMLYNTFFKAIRSQRSFLKRNINIPARLWEINNNIILKISFTIYIVNYAITSDALSDFIGIKVDDKITLKVLNEDDCYSFALKLKEKSKLHKTACNIDGNSSKNYLSRSLKRKLARYNKKKKDVFMADGKLIPYTSTESFQDILRNITQSSIHVNISRQKQSQEMIIKHLSVQNGTTFQCQYIEEMATRMVQIGYCDEEISVNLLTFLMDNYLFDDLHLCLKRYPIISENLLSSLLQYIFECYSRVIERNKRYTKEQNRKEIIKCEITKTKILLIAGTLVLCDFDENAMTECLRDDLDFIPMLYFLRFIHQCIVHPSRYTGIDNKPARMYNETRYTLDLQMLKWFGITLNAKIHSIAVSLDLPLIEILYDWNELLWILWDIWCNCYDVNKLITELLKAKENLEREKRVVTTTDNRNEVYKLSEDYYIERVQLF